MALFVKDDKTQKSDEPLQAAAPASASATASARDVQAHLGQGSRVEGKRRSKAACASTDKWKARSPHKRW